MNISKNRIRELIELFKASDNASFDQDDFNGRPFLKKDLIEAKVMVDRWGCVVTDWIFHSSKKEALNSLFDEDENHISNDEWKKLKATLLDIANTVSLSSFGKPYSSEFFIWGANVHFVDDIDPETAIGFSSNNDDSLSFNDSEKISNSIIVFKVS